MIVEDERRTQSPDETFQDAHISFCVKMPTQQFDNVDYVAQQIRDTPIPTQLKLDLIENIWEKFGFEN